MVQSSAKKPIDIINLLRWVYQQQKAHVIVDSGAGLYGIEAEWAGLEVRGVSGDGVCRVLNNCMLGTSIDGSGKASGALHPDAMTVHLQLKQIIAELKKQKRYDELNKPALVFKHALMDQPPDWMRGAKPIIQPMRRTNGAIAMVWDKNKNPVLCRLITILSAETINFNRSIYSEWVDGLFMLYERLLLAKFVEYYLKDFSVAKTPWS
jgi:hypothetical protein